MALPDPDLPPLLDAHRIEAGRDVFHAACEGARADRFAAGDLLWSRSNKDIMLALVLEPAVPVTRTQEMIYLAMVATADALGALTPPETAFTHSWPSTIRVNGAKAGRVRFAESVERDEEGCPVWLVIGIEMRLAPIAGPVEPGFVPDLTSLVDEGAPDLDRTQAIESLARHLLTWIHTWDVDGFPPVLDAWLFRADGYGKQHRVETPDGALEGTFLGIDEEGSLLLKHEEMGDMRTSAIGIRACLPPEAVQVAAD